MSCNGCRVLRKGCSDTCVLRQCLKCIESAEAQAHATLFVTKFFGRAGLTAFINGVSESQRPALFQSLLYEACGRYVNPVYGAVGLLYSGKWSLCQTAVETVLRGGTPEPITLDDTTNRNGLQSSFNTSSFQTCLSSMAPLSVESFVTSFFAEDHHHLRGSTIDYSNSNEGETKVQVMQPLKRRKWIMSNSSSSYGSPSEKKIIQNQMLQGGLQLDSCGETINRVNDLTPTAGLTANSGHNESVTEYESGDGIINGKLDLVNVEKATHDSSLQGGYDESSMSKVDSRLTEPKSEPFLNQEHCISGNGLMQSKESVVDPIAAIHGRTCQINDPIAAIDEKPSYINDPIAAKDGKSCSINDPIAAKDGKPCYIDDPIAAIHGRPCNINDPIAAIHGRPCYLNDPIAAIHGKPCYINDPIAAIHGKPCHINNPIASIHRTPCHTKNPISAIDEKPCHITDHAVLLFSESSQRIPLDNPYCFDSSFNYHSKGRNNIDNNKNSIELDLSLKGHSFPCLWEEKQLNLGISSPASINSEGSVTGLQSERTSPEREIKLLQLL